MNTVNSESCGVFSEDELAFLPSSVLCFFSTLKEILPQGNKNLKPRSSSAESKRPENKFEKVKDLKPFFKPKKGFIVLK